MHRIQEQLVKLSAERDITSMKLVDIANMIGVPHLQQVKHHRGQLIKHGLLDSPDNSKKPKIMKDYLVKSDLVAIPVLGSASAGPASIYADGVVRGYLHLSSSLLPKSVPASKLFALKVVGRSMNRAKLGGQTIENGDYVLVDSREPYEPQTGDYVVSSIEGLANIKKFVRDDVNQQIVLMSESTDDYPPIIISPSDYLQQNKVVQVVKSPKTN